MKESAINMINLIHQDLKDSGRTIDENQLLIFKTVENVSRVKFKKNAVIAKEGDEFNNIFFLAKGFVKVFMDVGQQRIFMTMLAPGDYMGMSLFAKTEKYPYSLIALNDSVVYIINKESFSEEVYRNPLIMKWVITSLGHQINGLYNKIAYLRCKRMNGRIAETLLYLSDDIFKSDVFDLPVTRKQLGHYANVSPENVTRILKAFFNEKIINLQGKNVKILNKETLNQISRMG